MQAQFLILVCLLMSQFQLFAQHSLIGDFEEWELNGFNISEPNGWTTQNETDLIYVEQVQGHSGMYAACLNVIWDPMTQALTGAILSKQLTIKEEKPIKSIQGYFSSQAFGSDSLHIKFEVFSGEYIVGSAFIALGGGNQEWRKFSVDLDLFAERNPDFAILTISIIPTKEGHHQSKFFIDDIELVK
jgi:hypothetical protein